MGYDEQSGQFKYKSQFTGEYILAHQYITEIVVDRKARRDKIELPYKYWLSIEKWKKEFKTQVQQAGKLLKKYDPKAIINALNNNKWCYSLMSPVLLKSIAIEQNKLNLEVVSEKEITTTDENQFSKTTRKTGLLGKINGNVKTD